MTSTTNVIAFRPRSTQAPLRRPRALIRAAREGQQGWHRDRDLPRLLHADRCPAPGACLPRLRAEEALLDEARQMRSADYDMRRHVLLMIAILAEMRAAVAATPLPGGRAVAVDNPAARPRAGISARGTTSRARP